MTPALLVPSAVLFTLLVTVQLCRGICLSAFQQQPGTSEMRFALRIRRSRWVVGAITGFCFLLACGHAMAATDIVSSIRSQYQTAANSWVKPLQGYATTLFTLLFTVQLCWGMCTLALRGADLAEFLAELVNQIMHFGI